MQDYTHEAVAETNEEAAAETNEEAAATKQSRCVCVSTSASPLPS